MGNGKADDCGGAGNRNVGADRCNAYDRTDWHAPHPKPNSSTNGCAADQPRDWIHPRVVERGGVRCCRRNMDGEPRNVSWSRSMFFRKNRDSSPSTLEPFAPITDFGNSGRESRSEPASPRGFRSLTDAMRTENPDFAFGPRLGNSPATWAGDSEDENPWQPKPLCGSQNVTPDVASHRIDACFASQAFLDDVAWSIETHGLRDDTHLPLEHDLDLELSVMESVQDLSRSVAKGTARRAVKPNPQDALKDWHD
jgi:hypothetical protein